MLCNFKSTNNEWICENCGRRVNKNSLASSSYQPTAKCRIPPNYRIVNNFFNKKQGIGDALTQICSKMNIKYNILSVTKSKINFLNSKSIQWCEQNTDFILHLLQEEAEQLRIPFLQSKFKAIIRLAIKNCKLQKS